ncbi:hypothetical protein GVAV_001932 [Gurleya vavrai]
MQNQTLNLLKAIKTPKSDNLSQFIKEFNEKVKKTKKVDQKTFQYLRKITNTPLFIDFINQINPTKNESVVIGRALMKSKIKEKQILIDTFCKKKNFVVLQCLLCTKIKVDVSKCVLLVKEFLDKPVCEVLRLLLVLWRNYRSYIDNEIIEFCKNYEHGICKEIYDEYLQSEIVVEE